MTWKNVILDFVWKVLQRILPDKLYLSLKYRVVFKKKLNWKNPKTFNEKLQWLKLYGFRDDYVKMADKVLVKDYVASKIGPEYIIPTLGVWKTAEDIDFASVELPFILKCNHDSGTVIACKRQDFDADAIRRKMQKALQSDYYLMGREKPYKYIGRRIMAEKFISTPDGTGEIQDFKFFCFGGEPRIFKINFDRSTDFKANYYDTDMALLPFGEVWPAPDYSRTFEHPEGFDKMLEICRTLSEGIPFVRVDLYNVAGKIYFGELTFYPTSGFGPFTDPAWDEKLGSWIKLPSK